MESQPAGKTGRLKAKNKKPPAKPKTPKKKKGDGPTCSMFLAELTRKLAYKKKQEEEESEPPENIVHTIIDTITAALPITVSKKTLERKDSPVQIETLQSLAPELISSDTVEIPLPIPEEPSLSEDDGGAFQSLKLPRMPVVGSDVMKAPTRIREPVEMHDIAVNTGGDHDVASEIAKHVSTLRKISLIAEEFNQKTAKNLKEIVDSVQEDLIKKLEEIQAEAKARERMEQEAKLTEHMQIEEIDEPVH
ncbi:uncharacterized protein LOC126366656 isoform X2 [Pectinophora gossypiella]|uniref:uncharacterized protein LOC126366656 isoform X2 n=1 Tax=Pectinophora gossypiella TaxID=13191 RepID=UPI00214DFB0F|nr:uncharacterized protein LOC126366656 isoform X2 [Pectinophora gossypiella]